MRKGGLAAGWNRRPRIFDVLLDITVSTGDNFRRTGEMPNGKVRARTMTGGRWMKAAGELERYAARMKRTDG